MLANTVFLLQHLSWEIFKLLEDKEKNVNYELYQKTKSLSYDLHDRCSYNRLF